MIKNIFKISLFTLVFWPCSIYAADFELSFQTHYPPGSAQYTDVHVPWAENIEKISNGNLKVNIFPIDAVVKGPEAIPSVKQGILDMAVWENFARQQEKPHLVFFSLPFIYKNARHGEAMLWEAYKQIPEVKAEIDDVGEVVTMWSSALYGISSMFPIRTPEDLQGKRVLFTNTEAGNLVKEWGGVPVFVTAADTYIGLQRGMGEAYIGAIPYQKSLRLFEVAKYITVLPSSGASLYASVNKDVWADLSSEQQKLLKEEGARLGRLTAESLDADVQAALDLYTEYGAEVINLTDDEFSVFYKASKAMLDTYWVERLASFGIKGDGKEWISRMYEISNSVPAPADK